VIGSAIGIVENVAMGVLGGVQTREALGTVDGAQTQEALGVAAPRPAVAVHAAAIQVAETDVDILAAITIPEILGLAQAVITITVPGGETMALEVAEGKSRKMMLRQLPHLKLTIQEKEIL
jgi:hypothetical protein